jgi:MFS family permease
MAMAVGAPTFGRMLDKQGSKSVILIGTVTLTLGMLMLARFSHNLTAFFIATVVIGFGLSALLGAPLRYILLNETDADNRSSAQGLMTIFGSSGQLISAAVIGAIISSGQNSVGSFSQAYLVIGIFSVLLVVLSLLLKNKVQESLERR